MRAAVLGSVWAASEIILGSFLHNLRLPFSGAFLSAIAVYLITAFDVKWKQNGVLIRAGLICALMKSVSPSAVIFGPMIAIFVEAVLFSASVRLLGRNFLGYGVGGALAVTWSLLHRIINMMIMYGTDVVKIYKNLYKYAEKVISIHLGSPVNLVIIVFAVYLLIGFTIGIVGFVAGKRVVPSPLSANDDDGNKLLSQRKTLPFIQHSLAWLGVELCMMVTGMILLSDFPLWAGVSFVVSATLINVWRYKKLLTRRFKLKFWLQLALITTLAGFFMNGFKASGWEFSPDNLADGFRITLRALLLTQCFGLLGIELANPRIKLFFLRMKLGKLPTALEAAFQALPLMLALLSTHKDKIRTPSVLLAGYIAAADAWIEEKQAKKSA